ncbi:MAG: hypothetical protein AMJ81_13755 [Phycisphaerae bacterium SM23_33]|nr:MAG: hypothetical protein AMJ81_13755 [Phycisphaerae bacterium SM23_33]
MDEESDQSAELQSFVAGRRDRLVAAARRILDDADEAEDVVQDTLAAVWRRLGEGRIEKLPRYLLRAVRVNALKRRARRIRHRTLDGQELPAPAEEEDDDGITPATLERAIQQLPPVQQAVIRMKYYTGMTFEEIGRALSVSMNTAASRCRYALGRLRGLLRRPGD